MPGPWVILNDNVVAGGIMEQTINQSRTEPSFTTGWQRVTATADAIKQAFRQRPVLRRCGFGLAGHGAGFTVPGRRPGCQPLDISS